MVMVSDVIQGKSIENVIDQIEHVMPALEHKITSFGYQTGKAGIAMYYYFMTHFKKNAKYEEKANQWLDDAILSIDSASFKGFASMFYRELAQLGIAIIYINRQPSLLAADETLLRNIDELLCDFMRQKIKEGDLNAISGGLVAGYYFLLRTEAQPQAKAWLEELVVGIEHCAKTDPSGSYYWRWPVWKSEGVYLGLHCGAAAILSFLAAAYGQGIAQERVLAISRRACAYVLAQKRDFPNSYFPVIVGESLAIGSLLQGDLGTCYGLLRAAQILDDAQMMKQTMQILVRSCERKYKEQTLIYDASILYGASGAALMYEKIDQITEQSVFKQAMVYWHQTIIGHQQYDNEFAGFRARFNQKYPQTNIAFSEGIVGIALTLMRYLDKSLPSLFPLVQLV